MSAPTKDTNNSVKVTYLVLYTVFQLSFIALAVAAPIWITPDYYWWTAFGIGFSLLNSGGFTARVNSWKDMGHVET
jgi:Trk-type K+ transport system membrane component